MTNAKAWVAAIFAGFAAGLAALGTALVGDQTLSELTDAQWVAVASAVLASFGGAFGLTWSVSNRPAPSPQAAVTYLTGPMPVTTSMSWDEKTAEALND